MKKLITGFIACICALVLVSCTSNTPTGKAKAYLEDYKDGNYREFVDHFHFKKAVTDEDKQGLANMLEEKGKKSIEEKGSIESYEITSEEIGEDGETATVKSILHYGNGSQEEQNIKLVKIDGQWLGDSGK